MNREMLQNQYNAEMDRKVSLSAAVNVPIVALTFIATAVSAMVLSFPYSLEAITYLFVILIAITVILSCFSVARLFQSLIGHKHAKLPRISELKAHFNALIEWHKEQEENEEQAHKLATKDFDEYYDQTLGDASDINSKNNIVRGGYVHEATEFLAKALIALLVSSPFYLYGKVTAEPEIHQIMIIEKKEIKTMSKDKQSTTTPPQKPQASEKPKGPPVQIFKDNSNKSSRDGKKD